MCTTAKILVIDAQKGIQFDPDTILSCAHCKVETASNGIEAMHAMERESFDVILLDQAVPAVDGKSVLQSLRNRWPDSEVIVLAACPSLDSAKEAIKLGAYDYLAKPVSVNAMINAANGAMNHKKWALRLAA
jgi:DNA-binding NtrC family response regulator